MADTVVLLNPRAGGGRAARLAPHIAALLDAAARPARLESTASVAEALALLRALPAGSRVVLAGGDGTVHHMLPALLERGHTLALLPGGTGNDSARAFGVHRLRWDDALRLGLNGAPSAIDVGELRANGGVTPFISSLNAGFDAAVAQRALRAPDWLRGLPRYLFATFAELAALRRFELQAWCDGALVHQGDTLFAAALNTSSYGSGMPAVPHARIDDGRLDLLVAGRFGRIGALAMLPLLLAGAHLRHPRVTAHAFTELRVRATPALPLAADGETLPDAAEFTLRVRAGALAAVRHPPAGAAAP